MKTEPTLTPASARRPGLMLSLQACSLFALAAAAPAQTWDSGGTNNNWSAGANWGADVAPVNTGAANVIFGSGARTSPNVDVPWSINSLAFQVGVPVYTIGGQQLTVQGGGITNASTALQTINNSLVLGAAQTWSAGLGNLSIGTTASTITNNGNLLTIDGSNSTVISGAVSGTGGIVKNGSGTLTIGGSGNNNTYTGATTVNAGTLVLNKPALSNDSAVTGNLIIGDGSGSDVVRLDLNYQIRDSVNVTINSSGLLNLNGHADDFTNLTMQGGSITTGAGSLGLNGDVTTQASNSEAGISGNLGLGIMRTFNIASGSTPVDLNIPANITSGGINKTGSGWLRLAGNNSYSAGLTLNNGTLLIGSDTAAGTGALTVNGGQLHTDNGLRSLANAVTLNADANLVGTGSFTLSGPATLTGDRTLNVNTPTTFSGVISQNAPGRSMAIASGNGSIVTFRGTSSNDYDGTTTVNSGTLSLDKAGGAYAVRGPLVVGDGAGGTNADIVRLQKPDQINSGAITVNASGLLDLNGQHQSVNSLTLNGGNITTAAAGELYLNNGTAVTVMSQPSPATISGNLTLSNFGSNTFDVADGSGLVDLDIPAAIGGGNGGGASKNGAGTLRLSGNNTFTGNFNHHAGTLALGSDSALGNAYLEMNGGAGGATLLADGGARTVSLTAHISGDSTIGGSNPLTMSALVFLGNGGASSLHIYNTAKTTFSGATFVESGSSVAIDGYSQLDMAGGGFVDGTLTHWGGLLTSPHLEVSSGGNFIMESSFFSLPDFNGTLVNRGTFTYNGGNFLGRLINHGITDFQKDFTAGNGMENHADLVIPAGRYVSLNGAGFDNQGTTTLTGGTLRGNGPLANNGLLNGSGIIDGSGGFTNNGVMTQGAGPLTIANTGANYNRGSISLAAGRQLQLTTGSLNNNAALALNGALLTGAGTLFNNAAGTLAGPGTILTALQNTGTIVPGGTLNVTGAWPNGGLVQLTGPLSSIVGGTVGNSGTIEGSGTVGAAVTNSGTIEALGGTLTITGTLSNQPAGTMAASTGNKLLVNSGLNLNAGSITLTGGTFDNGNRPLNNTGHLNGYGTLRTGALTNNGEVTFTGGVTTVSGDVTNSIGHQIHIAYDSALFTGNFINNGVFKNTDASVTFAGTYTENGTYISDPADNFFTDLHVGENGRLAGGTGDRFIVGGDLVTTSRQNERWQTGLAELRFSGGDGSHSMSVGGEDHGFSDAGFRNNFSWGTVGLSAGDSLSLTDENTAGGALYVGILDLGGGLPQIASIESNGLNIYYHPAYPGNGYLGGLTYALSGGGRLAPVPEPGPALLLATGALVLRRRSRHSTR